VDQLIQLGAEKTGLSFIEEKLPAPIAGQVDSLLSGEGAGDLLEKGKDMLGELFGDT